MKRSKTYSFLLCLLLIGIGSNADAVTLRVSVCNQNLPAVSSPASPGEASIDLSAPPNVYCGGAIKIERVDATLPAIVKAVDSPSDHSVNNTLTIANLKVTLLATPPPTLSISFSGEFPDGPNGPAVPLGMSWNGQFVRGIGYPPGCSIYFTENIVQLPLNQAIDPLSYPPSACNDANLGYFWGSDAITYLPLQPDPRTHSAQVTFTLPQIGDVLVLNSNFPGPPGLQTYMVVLHRGGSWESWLKADQYLQKIRPGFHGPGPDPGPFRELLHQLEKMQLEKIEKSIPLRKE